MVGNGGNDKLKGGAGDDVLTGGAGNDKFVFDDNWGSDTITDYGTGNDLLDMSASTLTYQDLTVSQSGLDTEIVDGFGNVITLTGIDSTTIDQTDFLF